MSEPIDLGTIDYHEATTAADMLPIVKRTPEPKQYPKHVYDPLQPWQRKLLIALLADLYPDLPDDPFDVSSWFGSTIRNAEPKPKPTGTVRLADALAKTPDGWIYTGADGSRWSLGGPVTGRTGVVL